MANLAMIADLNQSIAAVAPIEGISVGDANDKTTWRVIFQAVATPAQRASAQAVIDGYTFVPPPLSSVVDTSVIKILFNHENRIRTLEGKATITVQQFLTALVAILGG